jgi:hypothetical protein
MKYLLLILIFSSYFCCKAQQESHVFVTYDSTWNNGSDQWLLRISRPVGLFTPGSPDTASRPAIIMMGGQGQMGSKDTTHLTAYGPHAQYNPFTGGTGWDGGFQFGNGRHFPIIISVSHINNVYPNPSQFYPLLVYLINNYHIKRNSVYGTGLSEGSFTWGGIVEYEKTLGDHAGMMLVKALLMLEGEPTTPGNEFPARTQNCSGAHCDTNYYQTWAKSYGGRYFYLEGSGSDNFRNGYFYSAAMNRVVPNSAYFSYENAGGGCHCAWDVMWNVNNTNWTSVGKLGTYNAPSQAGTNTMGNYRPGTSTLHWLMEQGDTTLVGSSSPVVVTPPVTPGCPPVVTCPPPVVCPVCPAIPPPRKVVSITYTLVNGVWQQTITYDDKTTQ